MAASETPARDAVLVKYLNEAYGKEKQLETTLQAQIKLASRPTLKKGLQDHLKVTKNQARELSKRIKALGGKAETGPDLPVGGDAVAGAAGMVANVANRGLAMAKGPVQALRGTSEADNELRNVRDCYWNEAEEIAHYDVIEAVATELGDKETAKLAKTFRREEERMQALLEREIPKLVKAIVKEEVPAKERNANGGRRTSSRRSSAASSRSSSSRSSSSRSSGSGSGSSSSRSSGSRSSGSGSSSSRSSGSRSSGSRSSGSSSRSGGSSRASSSRSSSSRSSSGRSSSRSSGSRSRSSSGGSSSS